MQEVVDSQVNSNFQKPLNYNLLGKIETLHLNQTNLSIFLCEVIAIKRNRQALSHPPAGHKTNKQVNPMYFKTDLREQQEKIFKDSQLK